MSTSNANACPRCRQETTAGDNFCRCCGYPLRGQADYTHDLCETVVETLPCGLFILDAATRVVYWNRTLEAQSGVRRRDALRRSIVDVMPHLQSQMHRISRVFATALPLRIDQVAREDARGEEVMESFWLGPLLLENGTPALLGLVEDITQKVRVDSHLIRSERLAAVGELAAGVAHNFNNILAAIGGDAQLLKLIAEEEDLPEHIVEAARQIHNETMRGGRIAHDLLSFARGAEARIQRVEVREIVEDAARLISNHPSARSAQIQVELRDDLPHVEADTNLLHQVFFNVMLNALQAMPNGGILSVSAGLRGGDQDPASGMLDLKFHDTGVGISREHLRRIFDPFFSKRANGTAGSGLGLPVSLAMIQGIGGDIHVTSAEGIGTTVTVSLPIVERRSVRRRGSHGAHRGRALVVDDDANVRRTLGTLLTRRGFDVVAVEDGAEALKCLIGAEPDRPFDVMLTELILPKVNGITLIREALTHQSELAILVLTAATEQRLLLEAIDAGARAGLNKPPDFGELVRLVELLAGGQPMKPGDTREEHLQETCQL